MPSFFPSERRNRHQFIERTIEAYINVLDENDATNGTIVTDISNAYRKIIDNLAVPNCSSAGVLSLGKAALHNNEYIPIWSAYEAEYFTLLPKLRSPGPVQRSLMEDTLSGLDVTARNASQIFHGLMRKGAISVNDGSFAIVYDNHILGDGGNGDFLYMRGRPFMLLNQEVSIINATSVEHSRTSPSILHHELTHVAQNLTAPIHTFKREQDMYDLLVADEVEAYLHHEDMEKELIRQSYTPEEDEIMLSGEESTNLFKDIREYVGAYEHISLGRYAMKYDAPVIDVLKEVGLAARICEPLYGNG